MAGNVKGITIEFRGETTKLDKALKQIGQKTKDLDKELKLVDKALKFNPTNVELWRQKQEILTAKIGETEDKLKLLKNTQAQVKSGEIEMTAEEYRNLEREIITAESQLKTFNNQLKQIGNVNLRATAEQFKVMGDKLTAAGNAMRGFSMAGAAVVTTLGTIAYKAGQTADDLNALSKIYGISTTDLQKYKLASDQVDVSVETIAKSHIKLEKSMASAKDGTGAAADAFNALGVDVTNADGSLRNADEVWQDTLAALGSMEEGAERDALAMQLMGKSATDLNPLIEDGGETYKRVADLFQKYDLDLVDQETLDKANEFNDSIDDIKSMGSLALTMLGARLAEYLAPALEKVVDLVGRFVGWLANLDPEVLAVIGAIAGVVAVIAPLLLILGKIAFAISSIMTLMSTLGVSFAAIAGPVGIVIAIIAALIAVGVLLYKHWDQIKLKAAELKATIILEFNQIRNTVITIWNGIKTFLTNLWASIKTVASSAWEGVKSAIVTPIQTAFNLIKAAIDKIKNLFPLKVGKIFSDLKIPHIKVSGGKAPYGIGGKGSVPSINVDWYAQGGIFRTPTIFPAAGVGVGEAGPEAVLPISKLREMVDFGNQQGLEIMQQQSAILVAIYEELQKEKNFKVDNVWAGRYVNSLVK